ncbi:hypothetical protein AB0C34_11985 [Nocardia sp. NPDC049220]|uniref:hypothetical protein n=1 Tax=Nocardia sp. NPDC049220 TaxID=3155273 RepID=UPI0033E823B7
MTALKTVTAPKGARRRMVTVAALAAGAAIALSGCGAGQISQTADQASAVNGAHAEADSIALRNVHIVFPSEGGAYTNSKGGKAIVALSIINTSESVADELTGIDTDLGTVKITPTAGKSTVQVTPQQTVVATAEPTNNAPAAASAHDAGNHGAQPASDDPEANPILIEITGLNKDIIPGLTYSVSFDFKQNGTVQVQVPVDAGTKTERHES